jgi:hypothetical protein
LNVRKCSPAAQYVPAPMMRRSRGRIVAASPNRAGSAAVAKSNREAARSSSDDRAAAAGPSRTRRRPMEREQRQGDRTEVSNRRQSRGTSMAEEYGTWRSAEVHARNADERR